MKFQFGKSFLFASIIAILPWVPQTQCQNVEIIEVPPIPSGDVYLIEPPASYPSIGVDVFWKIPEDVDVKVLEFGIDAQSGDFILLSKYPLPDLPTAQLIRNLPISEYILLSSVIDSATFRLVNSQGVFIYFHGEYNEDRSSIQSGFKIEITPFDKPEAIVSTTTESSVTPPSPGTDVYVQRIIIGKTPYKFLQDLDIFKGLIAKMTNKYTNTILTGIEMPRPTVEGDVIVPIGEILYCDRAWPVYKTCVEVTFAINVYDTENNYVMTKSRIDQMWGLFALDLSEGGYASYNAPEAAEKPVAWVWVAVSLGTILVFSAVLCLAWYKKANAKFNEHTVVRDVMAEISRDNDVRYYDPKNPIRNVLKTMNGNGGVRRQGDYDSDYMYKGQSDANRSGNPSGFGGLPGLQGKTYQENLAYLDDEDDDVDQFNIVENEHNFDNNFDNNFLSPRFRHARLSEVPSEFEEEH